MTLNAPGRKLQRALVSPRIKSALVPALFLSAAALIRDINDHLLDLCRFNPFGFKKKFKSQIRRSHDNYLVNELAWN
jgi:hypothetical protein